MPSRVHYKRRSVRRRSDERGLSGHGHGSDGEIHLPGQVVGDELQLGIHRLVPGDLLSSVGGHASHDGHERAVSHPDAVVDGLAVADRGEQLVVFDLEHVALGPVVAPLGLACDDRIVPALDGAGPFGAHEVVRVVAVAAGDLSLGHERGTPSAYS